MWGRLFSLNKNFPSLPLIEDEYTFGRGSKSSVIFNSKEIQASKYYPAYSSTHFKIVRDVAKKCVFIQDLSSNGTFINGEKIGKNKKHVLESNTEIALASKVHRVFVYVDSHENDETDLPQDVREKYIVSKEIGRGAYGEVRLCFTRGKFGRSNCRSTSPLLFSSQAFAIVTR